MTLLFAARLDLARGLSLVTKEQLLKAIQELPAGATVEDAVDRLYCIQKIERGIAQAEAGQTVSHAEARRRMAR